MKPLSLLLAAAACTILPAIAAAANPPSASPPPRPPGLVLGPGPAGAWDSERVSCPKVIREPDGRWRMWYYGRDPAFDREIVLPTGRVGLAESDDGIHWRRVQGPLTLGAVFEPSADPSRFDSAHVGISDIQRLGDLYWMWYFAGDASVGGRGKGFPMRPGAAISRDGLNWSRVDGPYRGALLDVGAAGEFDRSTVAWPQVVKAAEDDWRMYYHGVDPTGAYVVGLARSRDGLNWTKVGPILGRGPKGRFDELGVATRQVLKIGDRWVMFYEGIRDIGEVRNVGRQLGVAVSDDGIRWTRLDGADRDGTILAERGAAEGGWDYRLGCPWVVPMGDGSLRLYYIGSNQVVGPGPSTELSVVHQIGLAVSDGDITRWRRWEDPR